MNTDDQQRWRFSPMAVAAASLGFAAANLATLLRWAMAPLVLGLAYHLLEPGQPGGTPEEAAQRMTGRLLVMVLGGLILLWVRTPMEIRIYRKLLLDEDPTGFYGQELFSGLTARYLGAYLRMALLFFGLFTASMLFLSLAFSVLMGQAGPAAAEEARSSIAPFLVALLFTGGLYAALLPRLVMLFPEVSLGGPGLLFERKRPVDLLADKARWRMLAVMAMLWTPVHGLNLLAHTAQEGSALAFLAEHPLGVVVLYLLGLATWVLSTVAGGLMCGHLVAAASKRPSEPEAANGSGLPPSDAG